MFFPELIKSIEVNNKVLEVGPGATPHPRSDVFLELEYGSIQERIAQSGRVGILQTEKPVVYYNGKDFPFDDNEFDYIICSHVLEHVPEPEHMISEIIRVGKKGYIEFPTIYYDYIWNIPEHITILFWTGKEIRYLFKKELHLETYRQITDFYADIIPPSSNNLVGRGKEYLMQGFEWRNKVDIVKAEDISGVTYADLSKMPPLTLTNNFFHNVLDPLEWLIDNPRRIKILWHHYRQRIAGTIHLSKIAK